MRARFISFAAVVLLGVMTPGRSFGAHHLWKLTQLFSNPSGSVQFVELKVTDNGEANIGGFTITSNGHTFTFGSNLSTAVHDTANTWVLVATPGYASLPGAVAPDYVLPASFFSTGGGTITYAGIDPWTYGTVPTDGSHSLMRDGTTPVNLAHNFAGASGSMTATSSVPVVGAWGLTLLIGALLLLGSGLLRRPQTARAG